VSKYRVVLVAALAVVLASAAMGSDSCGTSTKTTADKSGSGGGGGSEGPQTARLGDTITLTGFSDKETIEVTPTKVLDPLPVGSLDEPLNKQARFVGVELTLKNVGSKTYNDSPSNGATVVTSNDQQGDSTVVIEGPCSGGFASHANISPGSQLRGCLPFEVPGKKPVVKFQFTLASGFGPQSGEWAIK
jgi:hypothetical protein